MRSLENGLRVLASDVGVSFTIQQWQNVIEQIESAIEGQRKTLPAGQTKRERLEFLSKAAKEFFHFKDGWRNHVAHNRATYDATQALAIITHVRDFFGVLAMRLKE